MSWSVVHYGSQHKMIWFDLYPYHHSMIAYELELLIILMMLRWVWKSCPKLKLCLLLTKSMISTEREEIICGIITMPYVNKYHNYNLAPYETPTIEWLIQMFPCWSRNIWGTYCHGTFCQLSWVSWSGRIHGDFHPGLPGSERDPLQMKVTIT